MLRRLPKILRFIPGTAQDVRAYFLTLQYWLAGSERTSRNMVRFLVDRYADGPRAALRGTLQGGARRSSIPRSASTTRACRAASPSAPTRCRAWPQRQARHGRPAADALVPAGRQHRPLRRRDRRARSARPARHSGLRHRARCAPGDRAVLHAATAAPRSTRVVSLTGFSLVGGPAYNDAKAAEDMLAGLDVPYLAAQPVEFQTLEQWERVRARPAAGGERR